VAHKLIAQSYAVQKRPTKSKFKRPTVNEMLMIEEVEEMVAPSVGTWLAGAAAGAGTILLIAALSS
jgi:hypothetical protein